MRYYYLSFLLPLFLCSFLNAAEFRIWTGSNGVKIDAIFISFDEEAQVVKIRLKNGKEQNVLLSLFSEEDQDFIKNCDEGTDDPFGDADDQEDDILDAQDEGSFEYIFDGRSLNGWEGDTNVWRVNKADKSVSNSGKGNIVTKKEYGDFILQFDFKVGDRCSSGVWLHALEPKRHTPANNDTIKVFLGDDRSKNAVIYNGCVPNLTSGPKPGIMFEGHSRGWNFAEVILIENRLVTYINGRKVVDYNLRQSSHSGTRRKKGRIGLEGYEGMASFRHIRVKPIKPGYEWERYIIDTKNESKEGFKSIFDGNSFKGWKGDMDKWRAKNGILTCFDRGKLAADKNYSNFRLRFDYRISSRGNNGVFIRQSRLEGNSNYNGMEIQIGDDSAITNQVIGDNSGSLWGGVSARRGSQKRIGEWNSQEIIADGTKIKVILNDRIVLDTDIKDISLEHLNGWKNKSGMLYFGGNAGTADFRNIRIKEL